MHQPALLTATSRQGKIMYYDEQVIEGILHWRSTPDGKWRKFTLRQLTERLVWMEQSQKPAK